MSAPSGRLGRAAGALVALGALWASPALACDLRIATPPGEAVIQYDPFEIVQAPADLSFAVENRGDADCRFEVALVGADRVPVRELFLSDAPLGVELSPVRKEGSLSATATPGIWSASIAAGSTVDFGLVAAVVRDGVPLAGRHEVRLELELREPGSQSPIGSPVPVLVSMETQPRAQVNIAGAAGRFGEGPTISSVDLGVLQRGTVRQVFLQVRSNVETSRIVIDSEHDGNLVLEGDDVPAESLPVPYSVTLAGEPVDLRERHERRIVAPRTIEGSSMPLEIVVGDVSGRAAGRYSDVLSIDISPL